MRFSFFAYSKFTPLPHADHRAKPYNYSLIIALRIIFLDLKNKILKIGCQSRGFAKIQKYFFFKNNTLKRHFCLLLAPMPLKAVRTIEPAAPAI